MHVERAVEVRLPGAGQMIIRERRTFEQPAQRAQFAAIAAARQFDALAVDLLVGLLQNSAASPSRAQRIVLPTELIVRESCGALR